MINHTHHPTLSPVTVEQVTALVDAASAADMAAIQALEAVTNLRARPSRPPRAGDPGPDRAAAPVLLHRSADHRAGESR